MSDYRVNLDIFAGPLDLLLYLVRKEEVDIYDIPLAKITDQYIQHIEMLKSLDIDLAGDFLVMAATLMHIKSAMLLPQAEPDQPEDGELTDPRAELIRQLLEYKKFKDAANLLASAADEQGQRLSRPNSIIQSLKADDKSDIDMDQVSVWDLLEAFDSIMAATGAKIEMSHITDDTPIDLYQIEILHRLQTEGPVCFERVFEASRNRAVMVGLFLALLELIRDGLVWAEQPKRSASIFLKSLTDESPEQAVQRVIAASASQLEAEQRPTVQPTEKTAVPITELPSKAKPTAQITDQQQQQTPIPIAELPAKGDTKIPVESQEDTQQLQEHSPQKSN